MALIPKTVGELRNYLETWEDDKRILLDLDSNNYNGLWTFSIVPMFHGNDETLLTIEPFERIEDG